MEQLYITNLKIEKVRHLQDIEIPLEEDKLKHLILTGKNGSGKTSVLEALAIYLKNYYQYEHFEQCADRCMDIRKEIENLKEEKADEVLILEKEKKLDFFETDFYKTRRGLELTLNRSHKNVMALKEKYHYILAYYKADRIFKSIVPKHVEKIELKDDYDIDDNPRNEFVKYLLDLKMTEALARSGNKHQKADEICLWFEKFENLLRQIFNDDSVQLIFDEETFTFQISQDGKELFDFNTLSSGYQAVLDIVLDIIMRMEKQTKRSFQFNLPGIVLIDEIDTHLHLEMQKKVMPMLTTIFPNVQFVVTSHSPFILNSIENAVIYDLENHILVKNGLEDIPYDGVVEGYFGTDKLSNILQKKYERYKELADQSSWTDEQIYEMQELELYLDEIPDYLALEITTEYQRLKLQIEERME